MSGTKHVVFLFMSVPIYLCLYWSDKFTYLGSSVESTEKDIETRLAKAWTAINRLSIIWKSDLTDKMKRSFFQAAVTSILLYGCTTWTLTKRLEKKLDGNYTRMLRAILNKSWRQHPTRHQLYGHLPPITKTIQVRRTRHAGHCWRSRDELIRDVLLWTPTHGRAKAGRPARTYIQQLCEDTGCCPEDLPRAMNDREEWRERVRDIRTTSAIWWWWWWYWSIYSCSYHSIYLCLFISIYIYPTIYLSICQPIYICSYLSIRVSQFISIYLSLDLSIYLSIYLSISVHINLSICVFLFLPIYLSIFCSYLTIIYQSIYVYIYLYISVPIYLSIKNFEHSYSDMLEKSLNSHTMSQSSTLITTPRRIIDRLIDR